MRRSTAMLMLVGIVLAVPVPAFAGTSLKAIPKFSQARDGVLLPSGGAGSVAVVDLPDDPIGPGTEYESLQVMGIPATIVPFGNDLSSYPVVILAGAADAAAVDQTMADTLTSYVDGGGVLIGQAVTDPTLRALFGIDAVAESTAQPSLSLCSGCDPTLADVTTTNERDVELDDVDGSGIGTVDYTPSSDARVLGSFPDGTAALLAHPEGDGVAYAIGARLLDLVARHWEGARSSVNRSYANTTDADADAWLLWLRGVWRSTASGGITLSTVPAGVQAEVLMTISANWGDGILQVPNYLKAIRGLVPGAGSTVFIATHDATDWLDDAYFPTAGTFGTRDGQIIAAVQQSMGLGAELGSESVSHSPRFAQLPVGTGNETWQTYAPLVQSRKVTTGATVLGELLVSRGLLRQFQPDVRSYRAPYLLTSPSLAPAEDAVGYRFDSSATQGLVQTAFPFHPPKLDDTGFTNVFSFPITVEDDSGTPLASRIPGAIADVNAAVSNGAPASILITPRSEPSWRNAALKLVANLDKQYGSGLEIDSVATFGAFWSQRDQLALVTTATGSSRACGGSSAVAITVTNRGRLVATRQSLTIADPSFTVALLDTGRSTSKVAVTNGMLPLPRITPGHTISGVLCQ